MRVFSPVRLGILLASSRDEMLLDYAERKAGYQAAEAATPAFAAREDFQIVLVLGESHSRAASALYGSALPNEPELAKLRANGELIAFSDVIAPYSYTNAVMSRILDFGPAAGEKPAPSKSAPASADSAADSAARIASAASPRLNLVSLFKRAGFYTEFLSNQERYGRWGNAAASVGAFADHVEFSSLESSWDFSAQPDEILLERLRGPRAKTLTILHLMGMHWFYRERYPAGFSGFSPEQIRAAIASGTLLGGGGRSEAKTPGELERLADYFTALRYNDAVLARIWAHFRAAPAVLIYLSDHGEMLYERGLRGHGNVLPECAQVPFFVLVSPALQALRPGLLRRIQAAADQPFSTTDLIHTLCELAGMQDGAPGGKFGRCDHSRALFSDKFRPRPRYFHDAPYEN